MIGIFIRFLNLFSFNGFWYLLWFEDIKGKTFFFAEGGVNNELVLLIGMREVYDLITFVINVGRVIIVISDLLLGCNKFANICSRGTCETLKMVCQVVQVVTEVSSS